MRATAILCAQLYGYILLVILKTTWSWDDCYFGLKSVCLVIQTRITCCHHNQCCSSLHCLALWVEDLQLSLKKLQACKWQTQWAVSIFCQLVLKKRRKVMILSSHHCFLLVLENVSIWYKKPNCTEWIKKGGKNFNKLCLSTAVILAAGSHFSKGNVSIKGPHYQQLLQNTRFESGTKRNFSFMIYLTQLHVIQDRKPILCPELWPFSNILSFLHLSSLLKLQLSHGNAFFVCSTSFCSSFCCWKLDSILEYDSYFLCMYWEFLVMSNGQQSTKNGEKKVCVSKQSCSLLPTNISQEARL